MKKKKNRTFYLMLSLFSIELTIELIKIDDVDTDEFVDFAYIYIRE